MRRATLRYVGETNFESPAKNAGWLNIATFWYTIKIFKVGLRRDFQEADLSQPLPSHKSSSLGEKLSRLWSREVDKCVSNDRKPNLLKVIVQCFGCEVCKYGIILLIMEIGIRMFQPLFIGLIVRYFSIENSRKKATYAYPMYMNRMFMYFNRNQSKIVYGEAMFYSAGVVFCSLSSVLVVHPVFALLTLLGMKNRIAVCSLIYRKALRLSITEMGGATVGNVVNLLSNDVNRFDAASQFVHYLWIGPATLIISTYFLYYEIGNAAFVGAIPVIFVIPLQCVLGYFTSKLRMKTAKRTDNRVRIMNEIIQGIQVIKMYAWEYAFSGMVRKSRKSEMSCLIKASCIRGTFMSFILFTGRMSMFLAVYSALHMKGKATVESIFLIVAFYQILRLTMTIYFPQGVANIAELSVSIKRIEEFLMMPETKTADPAPMDPLWLTRVHKIQNYRDYYDKHSTANVVEGVFISKASVRYGKTTVLKNINLKVLPGQLTVIIGEVGSGKSCILQMVLGEMVPFRGTVGAEGVVSYASQDPWLFAGTVRQNILLGEEYDRTRYTEVVKVCALARDFTLLPYGDRTIVGERGISLSGGQRARVNLARAVYKDADIYLLDDPLSAVDPNVGKQLFDDCITTYLREKSVILCTHQLQYLKNVPQIVVMNEGVMEFRGSFNELVDSGIDFAKLIDEAPAVDIADEPDANRVKSIIKHISMKKIESTTKPAAREVQEMRSAGSLDMSVMKGYFRAGGNTCFILLIFLLFLLAQLSASAQDYFFSIWAVIEDSYYYKEKTGNVTMIFAKLTRDDCTLISSICIACTTFFALFRSYYFYSFCMRSSIGLHRMMFDSICHGHMRFFNTNPSGRILNRFSKDMGAVDELLPNAMCDTYQILLNLLGTAAIFMGINYFLILPTVAILIVFYFTRKLYLRCGRSIKRLEGVARSPVFSHVNATLQGLSTIRSHKCEMMLVEEFDYFQDVHTSSYFMFIGTSRAFGYILDLLIVVYTTVVTFVFVAFVVGGGANVALAITQCMGLTGAFQWGMRQSAELENQMTAVERLLEYTRIEHEPPLESAPNKKPSITWPQTGHLNFQKVFIRYSQNEDPVLKNLNMTIKPMEKIGIVGRTGAGKSTIISALFRLAYIEGVISIDDIDTGTIGLHDLRKKISIIPQEPVIFSGTLRYNLDPFQQYSDEHLFKAVVDVDLKIAGSQECLDEMMSEGGANLSVGSRQLVCLARAIVRNNKVLILDEATANVDGATDNFIQAAIREKFASCTVLTIAHRLNTVMDSDRVLVMDAGIVSEFDHPYILLQNKNGIFRQLVDKTGANTADKLFKLAKQSYEKKRDQKPQRTY